MYTLEQREKAIKLLIKYELAYTKTIRELGYPSSRKTLRKRYYELGVRMISWTKKEAMGILPC